MGNWFKSDTPPKISKPDNDRFAVSAGQVSRDLDSVASKEYCLQIKEEIKDTLTSHIQDDTAHITVHQIEVIVRDTVDTKLKEHLNIKFNKWTLLWTIIASLVSALIGAWATSWF